MTDAYAGAMRITKQEHACLVLEKADQRLVVDPGSFTTPLMGFDGIAAIVITHEHADHWTPEHLSRISERNPDVRIFGPAGVVAAASDFDVIEVADGDQHAVGGFTLRFFGENHAVIHPSIPVVDNVGVMVDDLLFYPGDAFTVPPVPVNTLAAPAGAPWLKISEAMDYVTAVAPERCFPTHQMVLSKIGQNLANDRLRKVTEDAGGEYFPLEPDESLDL
jgi:L-ascorbate metabolism protein UlaG (beta-lactamase superfamily)